jgi:hypothetical protein
MNTESIRTEVESAEKNLLNLLREGKLPEGVAIHLDDPSYHNIWNGEDKTFAQLEARIRKGIENGLVALDYRVTGREYIFINPEHVIQTLQATDTTTFRSGEPIISNPTVISILWKKVDGNWRLAYLHASENSTNK